MDKETISKIVSIVVTAAIALAAVFGYHIAVVAPTLNTIATSVNAVCK